MSYDHKYGIDRPIQCQINWHLSIFLNPHKVDQFGCIYELVSMDSYELPVELFIVEHAGAQLRSWKIHIVAFSYGNCWSWVRFVCVVKWIITKKMKQSANRTTRRTYYAWEKHDREKRLWWSSSLVINRDFFRDTDLGKITTPSRSIDPVFH